MVNGQVDAYSMVYVWYGLVCLVLSGVVWYSMVWYGIVWYGMVWCSVIFYGVVWCCVVWYMVRCGALVCMMWCGDMIR